MAFREGQVYRCPEPTCRMRWLRPRVPRPTVPATRTRPAAKAMSWSSSPTP